ncbi:MAG: hypothetical protein ACP5M9_00775 [Candidatus Micrarchaeia archaeon]
MITGIEVSKVEAKRENLEPISNMKFNINFDNVEIKQESVSVGFTFAAVYETGSGNKQTKVGELVISGKVMSKESKKDLDEIDSTWKNKKTLPLRFAEDVINLVNFECGSRGTLIAYSIGFAAPLPISRAKLEETK